MSPYEIMEELEKAKYHIKQLVNSIERKPDNAIQCMIVEMGFSEADVGKMYDILDKYDRALESGGNIDGLEMELRSELDIGYQEVKTIIISMFENHRFVPLCREYASDNQCMEFDGTPGIYKQ